MDLFVFRDTKKISKLFLTLVTLFVVCLVPSGVHAIISDNEDAVDLIGQTDDDFSDPQPVYTKSGTNNAPNQMGLYSPLYSLLDETNHRFFLTDRDNNRVLVFNLNNDNSFPDKFPDYVLGQSNFYTNTASYTQSSINSPKGITYDYDNDLLFVAQTNRISVFDLSSGITNGMNASYVLGQSDFTSSASATTQSGFNSVGGLVYVASTTELFVSEAGNNRVTVFDLSSGITDGMNATYVLGQSDFTTATGATTQAGMYNPRGIAYDVDNDLLFVPQSANNRVTVFDLAGGITNGMNASYVLGQSDFTSSGSGSTQSAFSSSFNVEYDTTHKRLFVSELSGGNRIKVFDLSSGITDGMNASYVIGQPDFTSSAAANTQAGLSQPVGLSYDVGNDKLYVTNYTSHRVTVYDVTPASMSNGMNAIDLLGQYDDDLVTPGSVYTKGAAQNAPNRFGLNFASDVNQTVVDTVGKRLFVVDGTNNRVLVFNLNTDGSVVDRIPDYVLGQANFYTNSASVTQSGFSAPRGVAYDSTNKRLFVSQATANRISVFDLSSGITNGMNASYVLGQSDFTSSSAANTQSGLYSPAEMDYATTTQQLFVAELSGQRVKVFDLSSSITDGMDASYVLGQSDFTSSASATTLSGMYNPRGVAYDATHNVLFVSQSGNNRIVSYDLSSGITNGMDASHVLGQSDFTTSTASLSQTGLSSPGGIAYDQANNRLFVADLSNKRIVGYTLDSISDGMAADVVIGQPDYTTNSASLTAAGLNTPRSVAYNSLSEQILVMDYTYKRLTIYDASLPDTTSPTISEVTPIATGTDTTPDYTFTTNEAGTITYGGSCSSVTTSATSGSNTITLDTLAVGTYSDCTITVTDASSNVSNTLTLTSFTISAPTTTTTSTTISGSVPSRRKVMPVYTPLPNTPTPTPCASGDLFNSLTGQPCPAGTSTNTLTHTFTKDLEFSDIDPEVKLLQIFLNTHGYIVSTTGAGSPGKETNYFGPATRSAVIGLQKANNITPSVGYFGPKTRGYVNGI